MCIRFDFCNWLIILAVVLWRVGGWLYDSVLPTEILSWWWGLLWVWVGGARGPRVRVEKNRVMGISVKINRGAGNIMGVEETGGLLRFVCKGWVCRVCLQLSLPVGILYACSLKVNSAASHVVSLSELHKIFANIWVVTGAFWSASTFRVFNIFFWMEQGVGNYSCYPLIHVCNTF